MTYTRPLSPSGLKLFQKCPKQWEDVYINGNKSEPGQAARRGTQIHAEIEMIFRRASFYPSTLLPLIPWNKFFKNLYEMGTCVPEGEVAVDKDWRPVPFNAPDAYFRGVVDLRYYSDGECVILDWKTGRVYPDHEFQAECYVGLTPRTDKYEAAMVYIDHPPKIASWEYTPDRRDDIIAYLVDEVEKVRSAEEFPPNPSNENCNWCPLNWRNGGACKSAP